MDFNIIKILSVPFNKVCPPGPFLVPASLDGPQIFCIKFDIVIASIRYTTQSLVLSISIQISGKLNQAGFTSPPPPPSYSCPMVVSCTYLSSYKAEIFNVVNVFFLTSVAET